MMLSTIKVIENDTVKTGATGGLYAFQDMTV